MQKILVVDDDKLIRDVIQHTFAREYDVLLAENGIEGIALALEYRPDLILCDINMPEADGFTLLLEIRRHEATESIPLVFLTAQTGRDSMRQGMAYGAEDYLSKPFTIEELRQVVGTQFEKLRRQKERSEKIVSDLRDRITLALPHELRTPIMIVQGYAHILMEEAELSEAQKGMLHAIMQSSTRLAQLAEKYLWYIRTQWMPSSIELDEATLDPDELILRTARRLAESLNRTEDVSVLVASVPLKVPSIWFERILIETIENAFKFSDPGTPVQVHSRLEKDRMLITIRDCGRGMKAEDIEAIGAFMQFDRPRFEQQGVGLGLVTAQRLIRLAGGTMNIRSQIDQYTELHIELPLALETTQDLG